MQGQDFKQGSKSRVLAAVLALFLGDFGIHQFYLGQVGKGFLYLLFCWTVIPWLVALVDMIRYLSMTDEKFWEMYG